MALILAKCYKISDRIGQPSRLYAKDAYDVYRLLLASAPEALALSYLNLSKNTLTATSSLKGLEIFRELFEMPNSAGNVLAGNAAALVDDSESVSVAVWALATKFLGAIEHSSSDQ